jgi:lysozyme family protein
MDRTDTALRWAAVISLAILGGFFVDLTIALLRPVTFEGASAQVVNTLTWALCALVATVPAYWLKAAFTTPPVPTLPRSASSEPPQTPSGVKPDAPKPPVVPTAPGAVSTAHPLKGFVHDFDPLEAEYRSLWSAIEVDPKHAATVDRDAKKILEFKSQYQALADETDVPWWCIGIIDMMEAGGGCDAHLHNGDSLKKRTIHVPAGRPPAPAEPPFTWSQSARDALTYEKLAGLKGWGIELLAWALEKYNGFGYRLHHVRSPYLWGFSNHAQPGKYVSDHHFDLSAQTEQAGGMTVLKGLLALDPSIKI